MRIAVASTFRDAVPYLGRYIDQCRTFMLAAEDDGHDVFFVWGENDSVDETKSVLAGSGLPAVLIDCSTGAPYYTSGEIHDRRWANVTRFCNTTLEAVPSCDVLLWVESDLMWDPEVALTLVAQASISGEAHSVPIFRGGTFYDIWGVRRDGHEFRPGDEGWDGVVKVDSSCGMLAIHGSLLDRRFEMPDAARAWCRNMGGVWLDTRMQVQHP